AAARFAGLGDLRRRRALRAVVQHGPDLVPGLAVPAGAGQAAREEIDVELVAAQGHDLHTVLDLVAGAGFVFSLDSEVHGRFLGINIPGVLGGRVLLVLLGLVGFLLVLDGKTVGEEEDEGTYGGDKGAVLHGGISKTVAGCEHRLAAGILWRGGGDGWW